MRLYWPRMREGIERVPKPATKLFNKHINNPSIHQEPKVKSGGGGGSGSESGGGSGGESSDNQAATETKRPRPVQWGEMTFSFFFWSSFMILSR